MLRNSNGSLARSRTEEVDLSLFPIEVREYIQYRAPTSLATEQIYESIQRNGVGQTFVMLVATSLKSIIYHYPTATSEEHAAMLGNDIVSVIGMDYFERLRAKVANMIEQEKSNAA